MSIHSPIKDTKPKSALISSKLLKNPPSNNTLSPLHTPSNNGNKSPSPYYRQSPTAKKPITAISKEVNNSKNQNTSIKELEQKLDELGNMLGGVKNQSCQKQSPTHKEKYVSKQEIKKNSPDASKKKVETSNTSNHLYKKETVRKTCPDVVKAFETSKMLLNPSQIISPRMTTDQSEKSKLIKSKPLVDPYQLIDVSNSRKSFKIAPPQPKKASQLLKKTQQKSNEHSSKNLKQKQEQAKLRVTMSNNLLSKNPQRKPLISPSAITKHATKMSPASKATTTTSINASNSGILPNKFQNNSHNKLIQNDSNKNIFDPNKSQNKTNQQSNKSINISQIQNTSLSFIKNVKKMSDNSITLSNHSHSNNNANSNCNGNGNSSNISNKDHISAIQKILALTKTDISINSNNNNYNSNNNNNNNLVTVASPTTSRPRISFRVTSIDQLMKQIEHENSLKISDFRIIKNLGSGKFSEVFLAVHTQSGFLLAIKQISKEKVKAFNMIRQVADQIRIHSVLNHPNIIKFYGLLQDHQHLYLLLQYIEGGSLFDKLAQSQKLPLKPTITYLRDTVSALTYLHDKSIAHRDLKPQNILVGMNCIAKVCDIGWSAVILTSRRTYCGTIQYIPPQILEKKQYDLSVDIWCLGVLAFELLTGKVPYEGDKYTVAMNKINNVQIVFPEQSEQFPASAKNFIQLLLQHNPQLRPKSKQLLTHQFLQLVKP